VQMGIRNFLFPSMWTSEFPFLTSNQIYQSWAYRNNVNLFPAGTNLAPATATGTGFFLGRQGNVFNVFSEDPLREFYKMRISKDPIHSNASLINPPDQFKNSFKSLNFGRDIMDEFVTELIDFSNETILENELCHEAHCCRFTLEVDPKNSSSTFQYRYVAFNGYRTYSGWGDKKFVVCAVILCNNETLDSCGRLPNFELDQVTFNSIEIATNFSRYGVLMMPNSLDMNMNPLPVDEFRYDEVISTEDTRTSTMRLLLSHSDLQTFALYGHDYEVEDEFNFDGSKWVEGSGDS